MALTSRPPHLGYDWLLWSSGVDPVSPFVLTFLGTASVPAGLPLSAIGIDAPRCNIYINGLLGSVVAPAVFGGAEARLPIPYQTRLLGVVLTAQSIALTTINNSNLATSNGAIGTLGF